MPVSKPRPARRRRVRSAVWPALLAVLLVSALVFMFTGSRRLGIMALYASASAVTFLAYGIDKSAAMRQRWRTPESTLHLLALVGGWPGALLGQRVFRHKSSKPSFRAVFFCTVLINCGVLVVVLRLLGIDVPYTVHGLR